MDNYELIEKLVNLSNRVEELENEKLSLFVYIVILIGCGLFFIGSLAICLSINHKYGDL